MNRLILISPDQGSGFKPISYGETTFLLSSLIINLQLRCSK